MSHRTANLTLDFLTLLAVMSLLGCASAAQVQEPVEQPAPSAQETDKNAPTPEPKPMPTVCVTTSDLQGNIDEECFVQATALPPEYDKLEGGLAYDAVESDKGEAAGESGDREANGGSSEETVWVKIHIADGHDSTAVTDLLDDNGIAAKDFSGNYGYVRGYVPVGLLSSLGQLESVASIEPIIELPIN